MDLEHLSEALIERVVRQLVELAEDNEELVEEVRPLLLFFLLFFSAWIFCV